MREENGNLKSDHPVYGLKHIPFCLWAWTGSFEQKRLTFSWWWCRNQWYCVDNMWYRVCSLTGSQYMANNISVVSDNHGERRTQSFGYRQNFYKTQRLLGWYLFYLLTFLWQPWNECLKLFLTESKRVQEIAQVVNLMIVLFDPGIKPDTFRGA